MPRPAAPGPDGGARRSGLILLVAAAVALPPLAACGPRVPAVEPGVSWQLAVYRSRTLAKVHYALTFAIPSDPAAPIEGNAVVTVDLLAAGRPVIFDFVEAEERVHSVSVDGRPVAFEAHDEHVLIPRDALAKGPNTISLRFTAGDLSLNRNEEFLYTLFVPDRARFAFPVFDQPNIKARYSLTLHVPPSWTAVANGPVTARDSSAEGVTMRFGATKPISSYLFAFAAGRFQVDSARRGNRWLRMYHRETDREKVARNREAVFDLHATALDWLEDYTGIPYPFDKFAFVAIPSFQYGGMEHPGAILYRASSLFLDEAATQNQLLGRASLIAHETSHMWFGDLVTMNWFDDVWTKEVFANFMAAKIVNPSFPEVDHDLRFLLAHYPAAYAVDRTAGANAIRQPLENLVDAGSLYGAIIYQKAPIVMKQLEERIGAETFRDGLREYLATHRYGNATWPDLIALLDARTEDDLSAWSHVWVEEAGRPRIVTELESDAEGRIASLRLREEDPHGDGRLWPERVAVLLANGDSSRITPVALGGIVTSVDAVVGAPIPDFILANGRGVAYGEFVPDAASLAYLVQHLPEIADPMVRAVAWITVWDAMMSGALPPADFVALARRGLEAEQVELNLQRILGYLRTAYWRYLTPAQREAVGPDLDAQLWRLVNVADRLSVRTAVFRTYRSLIPSDRALRRLARIWRYEEAVPGLPLAERDYATLALELAVREIDGWERILREQRDRMSNPDRRARFAFVMPAIDANPAVRDSFFETLRDPAQREHEPWVLEALSFLHHPLRAEASEHYLLPSLELVEEVQRTGDIFFPLGWLNATLSGHQSVRAAQIVRGFLDRHPDYPPRLRGKILQAADGLYRSAALLDNPD